MSKRSAPDQEMLVMGRICRDLALLKPGARRRVLAYVLARSEALPVIAAVGGGLEDDAQQGGMFEEVPPMPPLRGAAGDSEARP